MKLPFKVTWAIGDILTREGLTPRQAVGVIRQLCELTYKRESRQRSAMAAMITHQNVGGPERRLVMMEMLPDVFSAEDVARVKSAYDLD